MNISDSNHNKIILYNHQLLHRNRFTHIYIFVKVDFEDQFR